MTQSCHTFPRVRTVQLSWRMQNCELIWSLFCIYQQYAFLQDLDYELVNHLWNQSPGSLFPVTSRVDRRKVLCWFSIMRNPIKETATWREWPGKLIYICALICTGTFLSSEKTWAEGKGFCQTALTYFTDIFYLQFCLEKIDSFPQISFR